MLSRLVFPAYAASAVLALVIGVLLYTTTQEARESARQVDQALRLLQLLRSIDASVARAESAHRGYFLYRDEAFLRERDGALERAAQDGRDIGTLVAGDRYAQDGAARIRSLIAQRAERMRITEDAEASPNDDTPRVPETSMLGHELTASIYRATSSLGAESLALLEQRRAARARRFVRIDQFLVAALVVFVVLIAPGYAAFLRERRARMRAEGSREQLAESLPGAVFQFRSHPDGRRAYELLSARSESIRGISRAAAYRDAEEVMRPVHPVDRGYLLKAIETGQATLTPIHLDYRIVVDGRTRWIRTTAAPKKERDGAILWSGHWQDVTVQLEMEAELLRSREAAIAANRAKSSFLAAMSHEIRTPMNGVLGLVELLALTRLDADQRETVGVIRESGQALLRIIDDILDISKVEAGKLELRPAPASLRQVIERVYLVYGAAADSKGIALRRIVDPRIAAMHVLDAGRVQQVLNNLASNAVKFTPHGEVTLGAELLERDGSSETLRLFVRDTGIGLPNEQVARVFEPFEQGSSETWSQYGGTGLGLSICRRLAALMGGRIELESEHGSGTLAVFDVTFPVAQARDAAPAAEAFLEASQRPGPASAPPGRGRTVLVVDDHPIGRMVLARQLTTLGYRAESAESGEQALEKLARGTYGALLTDCNMPGMSGYELTRRIRDREREQGSARTPIIACTAHAVGEESRRCLEAGMDGYVSKPVALADLAETLSKWIPEVSLRAEEDAPMDDARPARDAPIDPDVFQENTAGDEALAREFLERFRRHNAQDTEELRGAAGAGRFDEAVRFAHRIRGASGALGAMDLAAVCGELERASRNHDGEALRAAMRKFEAEQRRLAEFIASRLARPSCS